MAEAVIRQGVDSDVDACVALWTRTRAARDGVVQEGVAEQTRAKLAQRAIMLVAELSREIRGFALITAPGTGKSFDPLDAVAKAVPSFDTV